MSGRKKSMPKELVVVRHAVAAKRNDIRNIGSVLRAPFKNDSGPSCDGGEEDITIVGNPSGRYLVAARFAGQPWVPLYSNASSGEDIFRANASSRKLEIAWFGCSTERGWFFRFNRAGKQVVEFVQAADADAPSTCKLDGVPPEVLKQGESGEQAVARLCAHFTVTRPMPQIRICEDGFEAVDAEGRPISSGLRGYTWISGPEIAEGENKAADALAKAIAQCDPEGIRAAITRGAPLTVLPGNAGFPLVSALHKFGQPRWKECVETLLELGCPVNGVKKEPPIIDCVSHLVTDVHALSTLELLLAHGADVNATDSGGRTALRNCVGEGRTKLIRFLLDHGADPNIKDRQGESAVDWARKRFEAATGFRDRTEYAELLSLLTGEPVARPQAKTLSPALVAENERFKRCFMARRILAFTPTQAKLQHADGPSLAREAWFPSWQKELLDAGFQPAAHLVGKSAYTNRELRFDAMLSFRGDEPSCEIVAYHPDQTLTAVANLSSRDIPEFAPPSLKRTQVNDASPRQLVEHLQKLVKGMELLPIDATSFSSRFTNLSDQFVRETRERAEHILKTTDILIEGSPPRYERLGCYLDFKEWKDPGYSSDNWVRDWKEEFAKAESNPPASTQDAVGAAIYLIAACHFQFASAPDPREFLVPGSDIALAHFLALADAPKECFPSLPWSQFRTLLRGLLLCALAGRWETFKEICNLVQPELASANTAQDEDLDFAQVLILLVSAYRDRAIPKAAALEQGIARRLAKRPRSLLKVWRAIRDGKAADMEEALRRSLECFLEMRDPNLAVSRSNDLFQFASLADSLFHLIAMNRGLTSPSLPPKLAATLITPASIGCQ